MLGNKIGIALILLLIGANNTISQEVISAAGNYNESNTGSVSWVLGEVIQSNMATLSNENNIEEASQNTNNSSSLTKNELKIEYSIYPNPFTDYISISIENDDINTYKLNIYNIQGKLISTKSLNQGSTLIPTKELAVGSYLAQIQSEEYNTEAFKIIKSK